MHRQKEQKKSKFVESNSERRKKNLIGTALNPMKIHIA